MASSSGPDSALSWLLTELDHDAPGHDEEETKEPEPEPRYEECTLLLPVQELLEVRRRPQRICSA